ncbi:hypothetical protein GOODEAATRI_002084 [Goodea atripinnis]|uniref:Sema domain-containing protein n=1 Tax=Goodea atripinnis TaxID=208336 RepID=A0ABV0MY02_9TELE
MVTVFLGPCQGGNPEFPSEEVINNVVADPHTGRLYVGAVNRLYQLNSNLEEESRAETGPKRDNRVCTPPITDACEEAVKTNNHNKLLLVHSAKNELVVCGSLFRGICSLRNLSSVEDLRYFSDTNGEKSYVASAEEGVSVVGVMSYFMKENDNLPVFLVGKGYGSYDSTKLISTRLLQEEKEKEWVVFDSIIDASAVQANPFVLRYLHDFRFAFKDDGFVYFLFSRTLGLQDNKIFTFISRMCENDHHYYSYTELQLNCSATNKYNKVQVTPRPAEGPKQSQKLLIPRPVSAFLPRLKNVRTCSMYPLKFINHRLVEIIGACYNNHGIIDNKVAVYSPYSSKPEEPCSTKVLKVHLSAHPEVYGQALSEVTGDKVNKNLLFDSSFQHLYITTNKKVRPTHTPAGLIIHFSGSISHCFHPSNASVSQYTAQKVGVLSLACSCFHVSSIRPLTL